MGVHISQWQFDYFAIMNKILDRRFGQFKKKKANFQVLALLNFGGSLVAEGWVVQYVQCDTDKQ